MFERTLAYMMRLNILAVFFFGLMACNDTAGTKKFEFYYYPARNVYYDVANTQFLYSVNGGKTWQSFKKELGKDPATLGSREVIYSTTQHPWYTNADDIQKYGGKIFSIADEDTTAQAEAVAEKKIVKKTSSSTTNTTNNKKEKKPGFFKRLFGGKKNN